MSEDLELWLRDPVECIRELIGNPAFREYISYAPERAYADEAGAIRIFDEMWTADWWWEMQVSATAGYVSCIRLTISSHRGNYRQEPQLHLSYLHQMRRA